MAEDFRKKVRHGVSEMRDFSRVGLDIGEGSAHERLLPSGEEPKAGAWSETWPKLEVTSGFGGFIPGFSALYGEYVMFGLDIFESRIDG